jgi:hypothetical protein
MKKYVILIQLALSLSLCAKLSAQPTPIPSSPDGIASLDSNTVSDEYLFKFNGETIYKYKRTDGGYSYNSGATFHGIRARGCDGNWFFPSISGGISANLLGGERKPWTEGITYKRISCSKSGSDTIISRWRMIYKAGRDIDSIDYFYKMKITGRTLVIKVIVYNSTNATGFEFDRCDSALNKRIVRIPYLPLFNLLYCNGGFTSLFADWESTNGSTI